MLQFTIILSTKAEYKQSITLNSHLHLAQASFRIAPLRRTREGKKAEYNEESKKENFECHALHNIY